MKEVYAEGMVASLIGECVRFGECRVGRSTGFEPVDVHGHLARETADFNGGTNI